MFHSKELRQAVQLELDAASMRGLGIVVKRQVAERALVAVPHEAWSRMDLADAKLAKLMTEIGVLMREPPDQEAIDLWIPNLPIKARDFLAGASRYICIGSNEHVLRWRATRDQIRTSCEAKGTLAEQIIESRNVDREHLDLLDLAGVDSFVEMSSQRPRRSSTLTGHDVRP